MTGTLTRHRSPSAGPSCGLHHFQVRKRTPVKALILDGDHVAGFLRSVAYAKALANHTRRVDGNAFMMFLGLDTAEV